MWGCGVSKVTGRRKALPSCPVAELYFKARTNNVHTNMSRKCGGTNAATSSLVPFHFFVTYVRYLSRCHLLFLVLVRQTGQYLHGLNLRMH